MKELNRYDFSNDKSFQTQLLSVEDTRRLDLPECDVISLRRCYGNGTSHAWAMRPDEALILARLLIDAVWQVTEGYSIGEPKPQRPKLKPVEIQLRRDGLERYYADAQREREREQYKEQRRERV